MTYRAGRSRIRGLVALAVTQLLALAVALPSGRAAQDGPIPAGKKVSLDFVQADINDVAKALSLQSGVNVVLMPSVKGNVTVRLTRLSPEEALQKTALAVGSGVRKIGDTYYLGSLAELREMVARGGSTTSLQLKNSQADEMKLFVQAQFPLLTVEGLQKSGILVVRGDPEEVDAAVKIVRDRDDGNAPPPVQVEPPKIVMTKESYSLKWANADALTETIKKAFPAAKVTSANRTLVLEGTAEDHRTIARLVASVDVEAPVERVVRAYSLKHLHPKQASDTLKTHFPGLTITAGFDSYSPPKVQLDTIVVETRTAFQSQAGGGAGGAGGGGGGGGGAGGGQSVPPNMDTSAGTRARVLLLAGPRDQVEQATAVLQVNDIAPKQVLIEARVVDHSPESSKKLGFLHEWSPGTFLERGNNGGRSPGKGRLDSTPFSGTLGHWARLPFDWQVTLEAMSQSRDARVLARPNISVIDGEESTIFIGDILRYERLVSVSESGQQVFTIESVPVGVALLTRPRITDDTVTLRVHPVVSTVSGFTGANRDIPITATREAESVIRLKDGESFAIGGLIREEDIRIMTKVPLLGDLPLLGKLFQHKNNSKKRSEVTIFLTVKILKD